MHHLRIDADFKIGDAWSLPQTNSYETELSEPLMKGGVDVSDLTKQASILVALQQSGLLDWVLSAAYDELWAYLKSYFQAVPQNNAAATASLKIKDANGKLRVNIVGLTSEALAGAKVVLKDRITTASGKVESEDSSIVITLAEHRPGGA
jgi:hypothetical protein